MTASTVLASQPLAGLSTATREGGTEGAYFPWITVNPESVKQAMVPGSVTYLFITFDTARNARLFSGVYTVVDQRMQSFEWGGQTAVLLRAEGLDAAVEPVTLLLQPVENVVSRVGWRAVVLVVSGEHVSATKISYVSSFPAAEVEDGTAFGFFGHQDAPLGFGGNVTPVAGIHDGGRVIDAVSWVGAAEDFPSFTGGPWFAARAVAHVPEPVEEESTGRPPPVDADTFWAYRACCECADVFLINDDALAERWDEPGSAALIKLDTLLLNHTDAEGTRWSLTNIEGWWTLPPPDLPELKRSGYLDGSFPVEGRYNAREFTVSGVFIPGPGVSVAVPRQRLLRSLDAIRSGALFVAKEPVWAKQAWVYLKDQPRVDTKSVSQLTEFEFTLYAYDPIKYHAGTAGLQFVTLTHSASGYLGRTYSVESDGADGYSSEAVLRGMRFRTDMSDDPGVFDPPPTDRLLLPGEGTAPNPYRRYQDRVTSGSVTCINAGTTWVWPRVYIYGPCSNPVVSNVTTGQQMRFLGDVRAGEVLVADCHWRTLVARSADDAPSLSPIGDVTGSNRRWVLDFSSQWLRLQAGENVLQLDAGSWGEGAKALVVFRSGWMG